MSIKRATALILATGLSLASAAPVSYAASAARAFPERPMRMVVPFPAGGGVDVVSRMLAQEMTGMLGQQVVVDNRSGASGRTRFVWSLPGRRLIMKLGNTNQ